MKLDIKDVKPAFEWLESEIEQEGPHIEDAIGQLEESLDYLKKQLKASKAA